MVNGAVVVGRDGDQDSDMRADSENLAVCLRQTRSLEQKLVRPGVVHTDFGDG